MKRPRILFLAHQPPWPSSGGGPVRTRCTLKSLASWADIEMATFLRPGADPVVPEEIRALCRGGVHCLPLRKGALRDATVLAGGWLGATPWRIARDRSPGLAALVADRFDCVDAIHVDHLPMGSALPVARGTGPKVVLDCHNAEHRLFAGWVPFLAGGRVLVARREAHRLRDYEAEAVRRADIVVATTAEDRTALGSLPGADPEKIHVVPVGMPLAPEIEPGPTQTPRLVVIGTWSWPPNEDALAWFASDILPSLRRRVPDAVLEVAGRPGGRTFARSVDRPGMQWVGPVASVDDFLAGATVCVAPLRCGAGIRIKALDALTRGVPVVATPIGAEGLPECAGVALAEDAATFADRIATWLRDPVAARVAGSSARRSIAAAQGPEIAEAAWRDVYARIGVRTKGEAR